MLGQRMTKGDIVIIFYYYKAVHFKKGKRLFSTISRYITRINEVIFNKGKCRLNIIQIFRIGD